MTTVVRSVPGKTFLLGEYVALDGGPSILLSTAPRFTLSESARDAALPFSKNSPAAKLAKLEAQILSNRRFDFFDPHQGQGGLGASSAQFVLLYASIKQLDSVDPELMDWDQLLNMYRRCAWNGEGTPPSGADVVAQMTGGICSYDGNTSKVQRLLWAFPSLSFTLIRTGVKLATHEHLKKTQAYPFSALRDCVVSGLEAFSTRNEENLVSAVSEAARVLEKSGLTSEATEGLLAAITSQARGVRAAKGCGAMGADVILVLHDRENTHSIRSWAASKGLEVCGHLGVLDEHGLRLEP